MTKSFPPPRSVARPICNLGNSCYMNCVLQALAHAPDLCLAMDCEPHTKKCPIAKENRMKLSRAASPSSSAGSMSPRSDDFRRPAARSLRRSSRRSPTNGMSNNGTAAAAAVAGETSISGGNHGDNNDQKYCALCELEWHLQEVHSQENHDKPVVPTSFVHGFINHVAPWFKLGQQEDSHEFLRLFIDAMQKSCMAARGDTEENADSNPKDSESKDTEYPFQLFRGTVESCVTCDSCKATSSTMDPIEDVGLEVTPTPSAAPPPGMTATDTLADVNSAFRRFARVEHLDAGYKCEKCGKGGRATKQSRLASIPPILTLHLKRFRYGADARAAISAAAPGLSNRRAKSGSAKIEGHIKFEQIFDLKPYLTEDLQKSKRNMFCRLFAVVVHAGKNSHSGHYIAYVRSLAKNEWWRMDDARVTMASLEEVMQAEAYMLFYRVVDHPIALELKNRVDEINKEREKLEAEARLAEEKSRALSAETEKENLPMNEVELTGDPENVVVAKVKTEEKPKEPARASKSPYNTRKRPLPDYTDGKKWARSKTRLRSSSQMASLRSAEEYINENIQFKPEFFKRINEEGSKSGAKADQCPIKDISGMLCAQ